MGGIGQEDGRGQDGNLTTVICLNFTCWRQGIDSSRVACASILPRVVEHEESIGGSVADLQILLFIPVDIHRQGGIT